MAATSFVAVQWQPMDIIDETKMAELANNIQYVYDNTPRARYATGSSGSRMQGVKIASGQKFIPRAPKKARATVDVNFGKFFSPGTKPHVTTGIVSPQQQNIFCTLRGKNGLLPDHTGMKIEIEIGEKDKEKSRIARRFAVQWIALGL